MEGDGVSEANGGGAWRPIATDWGLVEEKMLVRVRKEKVRQKGHPFQMGLLAEGMEDLDWDRWVLLRSDAWLQTLREAFPEGSWTFYPAWVQIVWEP